MSGLGPERYLRERVFGPLGMESSDLVRSERVRPRLATGYVLRPRGLRTVADREIATPGAGRVYSTISDPDGDDPYAFRIDLSTLAAGTSPVVFSRNPGGAVTALHLGLTPMSFQKRPEARNPRRWVNGALIAGAAAIAVRRRR